MLKYLALYIGLMIMWLYAYIPTIKLLFPHLKFEDIIFSGFMFGHIMCIFGLMLAYLVELVTLKDKEK